MNTKKYRSCMSAPLGQRKGILSFQEAGGRVDGCLEMMNRKNAFFGRLSKDGQIILYGAFQTLISTVQYTATGSISGRKIRLNLKTTSGSYYPISGEEFNIDDTVL